MEHKDKQNPGKILKDFNKEIENVERLIKHLDDESRHNVPHTHVAGYGVPEELWKGFRAQAVQKLEELRAARAEHLGTSPPPPPSELKCPYCGYDGEFDVDEGEIKGMGFRLLEPILEPRAIFGYEGGRLLVSDPDETHDPFTMIADPGHWPFLDETDNPIEKSLREDLKGRYVIVCGNEDCLAYFDGRPFAENADIEYTNETPYKTKWRR